MDLAIEKTTNKSKTTVAAETNSEQEELPQKSIFLNNNNETANIEKTEQISQQEAEKIQMAKLSKLLEIINNTEKTPKLLPEKNGIYNEYSVAIIDDFEEKYANMFNLSHGKVVRKFITGNLPGIKIEELHNGSFLKALEEINKQINEGKKYDAINISLNWGYPIPYSYFKFQANNEITELSYENINQYKLLLKESYKKILLELFKRDAKKETSVEEIEKGYNDLMDYTEKLDKLIKNISNKGIKIFLANNNSSNENIFYSDLFDIDEDYKNANNPNIITVSANDKKELSFPLSDIKERACYTIKRIGDELDITGDDIPDIVDKFRYHELEEELLGKNEFNGNSFATPTALYKYIKELHNKKTEKQQ